MLKSKKIVAMLITVTIALSIGCISVFARDNTDMKELKAEQKKVESRISGFNEHVTVIYEGGNIGIMPMYDTGTLSPYTIYKANAYTQIGQARYTLLTGENATYMETGSVTNNQQLYFNILDETTQTYVNASFMGPVYANSLINYNGLDASHVYTFRVNSGTYGSTCTANIRIFTATY